MGDVPPVFGWDLVVYQPNVVQTRPEISCEPSTVQPGCESVYEPSEVRIGPESVFTMSPTEGMDEPFFNLDPVEDLAEIVMVMGLIPLSSSSHQSPSRNSNSKKGTSTSVQDCCVLT